MLKDLISFLGVSFGNSPLRQTANKLRALNQLHGRLNLLKSLLKGCRYQITFWDSLIESNSISDVGRA